MNKKDEGKFKKLLKKHGLKLVDTIYEGSKKLDEQGPLGGGLTNPTLPFLPQVAQRQKTGRYRTGRREIGRRRPAPGLVNPGGPPIQFEGLAARDEGYEMRGLGSKGLRNMKVSKKVNAEKVREVLTSARIPHSMVMGTIRVPERFVKLAKKKLDNAFGGMFQKKTGFKISGTLKEDVHLDEEIAARDIQGMIKGLNKKAKQEIAGVLNDMNLSGYGDYEARADNVHKFKPSDLKMAMQMMSESFSLSLEERAMTYVIDRKTKKIVHGPTDTGDAKLYVKKQIQPRKFMIRQIRGAAKKVGDTV